MKKNFFYTAVIFLLSFALNSCQKEISEENGKTNTPSAGSLKDSSGNCYSAVVTGTYYNGVVPGSDTANVVVQVNVTTPGTYHIYTDMQNGLSFSDTGYFTSTGISLVTLRPSGTPLLPVTTNFLITYDTSICSFSINIQDSTGTGLGGHDTTGTGGGDTTSIADNSWQFTDNTNGVSYSGPMSGGNIQSVFGLTILSLSGFTQNNDTLLLISLFLQSAVIETGTFMTGGSNAFQFNKLTGDIIFLADSSTDPEELAIVITSYDSVTKVVKGTFSGTMKDSSGNTIQVTNGAFSTTVT